MYTLNPNSIDELKELLSANGSPVIVLSGKEFMQVIDSYVAQALREHDGRGLGDGFLPRKEAASYCGVCLNTLFNWSQAGLITKYHHGGRVFFLKDELDRIKKPI